MTPWKKTDPKKAMTLDEFADLMAKTPGWAEEKVIERKVLDNAPKGQHAVYRVPRCAACSPAAAQAPPLPWAEAS